MFRGSEQTTAIRESWADDSSSSLGEIQPHGCLLCFTRDLDYMLFASANSGEVLGGDVQEKLGQSARSLNNDHVFDQLMAGLATHDEGKPFVQEVRWNRGEESEPFQVTAWAVDDRIVVEFEPSASLPQLRIFTQTNNWLNSLAKAQDENTLFERLARGIFELTGYDRVLVLDMHEDGCATVVAESKLDTLASMLAQRIPRQQFPSAIREVYALNPTRTVMDTQAEPVPLLAAEHPLSRLPLDLRHGHLRAVPSIYRTAMMRMGVRSGLHLAIYDGEGLRALVMCHTATVTPVPPAVRDTCWTLAQMGSHRLAFLEMRAHRSFERRASESRSVLTEKQAAAIERPDAIVAAQGQQWLALFQCSGVALLVDRQITVVGDVPDADALWAVKRRLTAQHHMEVSWWTDRLATSILADAGNLKRFGGVLALRLPTVSPPGWLLFFGMKNHVPIAG